MMTTTARTGSASTSAGRSCCCWRWPRSRTCSTGSTRPALRRPALDTLLISGASIGLLALGAGLTLRAGVPNLAVGPIALAAALHFAENGDDGLLQAALPALIIAAAGGLVVALFVLALHVPGWVATLGGGHGRHRL